MLVMRPVWAVAMNVARSAHGGGTWGGMMAREGALGCADDHRDSGNLSSMGRRDLVSKSTVDESGSSPLGNKPLSSSSSSSGST